MAKSILLRSSLRYLFRHPVKGALSVLGVALGVAIVVAIDLANQSAGRAFELSMESITGRATHQIVGGPAGLRESLYTRLRLEAAGVDCAPVVEGYVRAGSGTGRSFLLFGVDPLAERPFRSYLAGLGAGSDGIFSGLLTEPASLLMSPRTARELNLRVGSELALTAGVERRTARVLGLLEAQDSRSRAALEGLLVADIATAQELLDRTGRLSRIDVILPGGEAGEESLDRIRTLMPEEARLIPSRTRTRAAEQMVSAFKINLTAMSLLALIVGMFLIYSTMTVSVLQRTRLIGLLRSIGVTRREVFGLIMIEALLLGCAGTLAGTFLGIVMGKGLVGLVARTINDLYFVLPVTDLSLSSFSLAKGVLLGVGATAVTALNPAREAAGSPPGVALLRFRAETRLRRRIPRLILAGGICLIGGAAVLWFPGHSVAMGYLGIAPVILGFALLTPAVVILLMRLATPALGALFGGLGRLAARSVASHLSRTAVAIAALGLAVAAVVGVDTTVGSFRGTVVHWLESRLLSDIYISGPSTVSRRNDADLPADLEERIRALPGVARLNMYREIQVATGERTIHVIGAGISEPSRETFRFKAGDPERIWPAFFERGAVILSEPYAFHHDAGPGDVIEIPTHRGVTSFEVAGIYYDYGSDLGLVTMSLETYRRHFDDMLLSGIAVQLEEGAELDPVMEAVRGLAAPGEILMVRSNKALRETSLEIFDRTFIIADVIKMLAVIVAFIGILGSLTALQLERARELAVLRANGMTPRQLFSLVQLQTGLMGFSAGLLALPLGNALAWILIFIINRRSFGWTLQFHLSPAVLAGSFALALVAAFLAGLYPAVRMARQVPADGLREE